MTPREEKDSPKVTKKEPGRARSTTKVYPTPSQTGLHRKGNLLDFVTEKSGLGVRVSSFRCGWIQGLPQGAISRIYFHQSFTSVLAFFPRGTPVCTFPGVVEGWSQQYLNPVDGDWGTEVPP